MFSGAWAGYQRAMHKGCLIPLTFLAGFAAGYVACAAIYIMATMSGFHDREGAMAMGVFFMIGPFVGLGCGVGAAIWALVRRAA